jgi:CRP/FNR family transcriptional regulator, anaerobic regulatory protein
LLAVAGSGFLSLVANHRLGLAVSSSLPHKALEKRAITACAACPLRTMKKFRKFTDEELRFVQSLKIGEINLKANQTLVVEDDLSPYLYTVLSGWLFKYKMLDDGRRQIVNYAVPGDLLGLQSAFFDKMLHSIETLSEATLCVFPRDKLWTLFQKHQGLGFDVTWLAAEEKSILSDFLVSVGQRSASERIAFMLLTLFRRAAWSTATN